MQHDTHNYVATPVECWGCEGAGQHHAEDGGGCPIYRHDSIFGVDVPVTVTCNDCDGSGRTCSECGWPWNDDEGCAGDCEVSDAA